MLRKIAFVAGKYLITTIARQQHRAAIIPRHFGAEIGGNHGGIAEGLVVSTGDDLDGVGDVAGSDIVFLKSATVMGGALPGIGNFIVTLGIEADGIGGGMRITFRQQADNSAAVQAAAEKGAGDVRRILIDLPVHGLFKPAAQSRVQSILGIGGDLEVR